MSAAQANELMVSDAPSSPAPTLHAPSATLHAPASALPAAISNCTRPSSLHDLASSTSPLSPHLTLPLRHCPSYLIPLTSLQPPSAQIQGLSDALLSSNELGRMAKHLGLLADDGMPNFADLNSSGEWCLRCTRCGVGRSLQGALSRSRRLFLGSLEPSLSVHVQPRMQEVELMTMALPSSNWFPPHPHSSRSSPAPALALSPDYSLIDGPQSSLPSNPRAVHSDRTES